MEYTKIHLIYFSPTHTSARIAHAIARATGVKEVVVSDLTLDAVREVQVDNALAVIAVPVYGGRVAETAMERLASVRASNSVAIPVVLYGNRDYEDALRELTEWSIRQGFVPLGAGAFIGEHSYSRKDMPIAANRPDALDLDVAGSFARKLIEKLSGYASAADLPALEVKGEFPYKVKGVSVPAAPFTLKEDCTQCGHCVEVCPTGAVSLDNDGFPVSEKEECIKCCAYVKECPAEARVFDTPYTAMLFNNFKMRREPEVFF